MAVITVRIDDETKKRMERLRINWSEYIRSSIKAKLNEEEGRNLALAVLINEKLRKKANSGPTAEEIIRKFRDERRA